MLTFIVRFVSTATNTFCWKVRHMVTGEETSFSSPAELIAAGSGTYTITLNSDVGLDRVDLNNTAATLDLGSRRIDISLPAGLANSGTVRAGNGAWLACTHTLTSTGQLLVISPPENGHPSTQPPEPSRMARRLRCP